MSKRNMVWLGLVVVAAVVGSIVFDAVLWGVVIGVLVLALSEIVERARRRRRAATAGAPAPKPLRTVAKRKSPG